MYYFAIENEYGNKIDLTGIENRWQLTSVTGLNTPPASISTSVIPTFDGERFNSSRVGMRNIVITLAINGNAEENRNTLNSVIMSKRRVRVYYSNNSRELYIDGYVESFEYDVFSQKIMCQISIVCPDPFWKDLQGNNFEVLPVVPLLEFPIGIPEQGMALSELMDNPAAIIYNNGLSGAGVTMSIESVGDVLYPWIVNTATGQRMEFNMSLNPTQSILISTVRGNKKVFLLEDSKEINALMNMEGDWLTLNSGANSILIGAQSGVADMRVNILHRNEYGGV